MKKILFSLLATFLVSAAYAQDVLIKRNGEEVQVRVLELTPDLIKYRRFDNPEGPLISVLKADVFMIRYENGTKEVFNEAARSVPAPAQAPVSPGWSSQAQDHLRLAGPRIGFTILSQQYTRRINDQHGMDINPFITQFGWQFETRIFSLDNGLTGLFEFVPLIGGLEKGKFLPSLSALIGIRSGKGLEFGVGPNVSLAGAGLVFAVGTNIEAQGVNFPINFAVAPSADGARFSLLFGFNSRRR